MKTLFILGLLVCIAFAYNGYFPRSEQTCQDQQVKGLFWDGQKCEVCANEHCYCNEYRGCTSCEEGYSLFEIQEDRQPRQKCYKCPDYAKECCFHGVGTDYKESFLRHDEIAEQFLVGRALNCYSHIDGKDVIGTTRRYGSYCHYIPGCVAYNNYGQCFECVDGYYFNQATGGACLPCPSNCLTCHTTGQCDVCRDGFYMQTTVNRKAWPGDDVVGPSTCEPCAPNCKCTGKVTNGPDTNMMCDLGCIDERHLLTKGTDGKPDHCEIVCEPSCEKCIWDAENEKTKCMKCYENKLGLDPTQTSNALITAPLNSKNECLSCPKYCYECKLTNDTPSCVRGKCMNGYYEVQNEDGIITCKNCDSTLYNSKNLLRCSGKEKFTQCGTEGQTEQYISYEQVSPPHMRDSNPSKFSLVGANTSDPKCIRNEYNCKTVMYQRGDQEQKCTACYEDLGYQLEVKTQRCVLCTDLRGCRECTSNGGTTELQCLSCFKVQINDWEGDGELNVPSFYLNPEQKYCQPCGAYCHDCDAKGINECSVCQHGYYLTGKTCSRCKIAECQTCTQEETCETCFPGFALWKNSKAGSATGSQNYACLSCPYNCKYCKIEASGSDRRVCETCNSGYYLQDGICHPKRSNCYVYKQDGGACEFCRYGWRVVDGHCHRAFAPDQAYVNVEFGCTVSHRIRDDGDLLNREQFQDWLKPISANILGLSMALIGFVLFALV